MNLEDLTPSTIAIAGDWHGNYVYMRKAIRWCHKQGVDTIIHLGDFGFWHNAKGKMSVLSLDSQMLERLGMTMLVLDGNHENHDWLDAQPVSEDGTRKLTPNLWHLPRGLGWNWTLNGEDTKFVALGGAYSMDRAYRTAHDPEFGFFTQEVISDADVSRAISNGYADIMLSHDSPLECQSTHYPDAPWHTVEDTRASYDNQKRLSEVGRALRPREWFHGHHHHRYDETVSFSSSFELTDESTTVVHGMGKDNSPFTENIYLL